MNNEPTAHPCPYRTSADEFARCRLVGDFVGNDKLCGVHVSLCKACTEKGPPDLTTPNVYLAGVAYKACNANANKAAAANDRPAWFHWSGLAAFFHDRLLRVRPTAPKDAGGGATRPKRCEHLGNVVERKSCNCDRKHVYECNRFRDSVGSLPLLVSPIDLCERCPGYEPDADAEPLVDDAVSSSKS